MSKSDDKRAAPPIKRVPANPAAKEPAKRTAAAKESAKEPSAPSREFETDADGNLYTRAADGTVAKICSPIEWKAFVTDTDGRRPAHLVEITTIVGSQTVEIPIGLLDKPKKLKEFLVEAGMESPPAGEAAARQLVKLFATFPRTPHIVRVERDGWIPRQGGSAYVFGNTMYAQDSAVQVRRTVPATASQRGDPEKWPAFTRNLAGNPVLVAAACFGFASALLKPFGHSSSFIVAFVGPSSIGKSSALRLAQALMTDPQELPTWNGTRSGLIVAAGQCSDKPLVLDEIGQAQVQDLGALTYDFGNGATRQRATSSGRLAVAAPVSTVTLVSGEVSTFDLMRTAGHSPNGGQVARCITIPAGNPPAGVVEERHGERSSAAFVRKLNNTLRENHGIAWPQFVSYLAGNLDELRTEYRRRMQKTGHAIVEGSEYDRSNNVLPRVIGHFALATFAGFIATRAGVLGLTEEEITSALRECFRRWLTTYVTLVKSPEQTIIEEVRALIASRKAEIIPYADSVKKPEAFGYLYTARGKPLKILVNRASFDALKTRHGEIVFHNALRASGLVKLGPRNSVTDQKTLPDGSRPSFYEFRATDFGL